MRVMKNLNELSKLTNTELLKYIVEIQAQNTELQEKVILLSNELAKLKKSRPSRR